MTSNTYDDFTITYDFLWNPMSKSPLSVYSRKLPPPSTKKTHRSQPPKVPWGGLQLQVTTSPPHRGASQTCIRPATRAVPQIKTEETKTSSGVIYTYIPGYLGGIYIYIDRYTMKKTRGLIPNVLGGHWILTSPHGPILGAKKVTNELPEVSPWKIA